MWIKSFLFALAVFAVLSALTYDDVFAQGRDRSKYIVGIDTSTVRNDTSKNIDTNIVKVPVDSTARIKNFKYDRKDHLHALFGEYESPILLYNSTLVERQVTFDSLNNVVITEKVSNEDIRYPVKIPFDKYISIESDLSEKNQLYKIVADFYKIETADELEQLFKNITEITIPLPFSSETIFGPPTINLKINGVIDITASYQRSTTDELTITQTPTQNNINFKQDVQVTTKGSVGDKLTIDADWNSQRTFDFENQLKLKYKGYPDEVVQSIEAGNVSLETKSNLIGSTQALFGVKAAFKLGPLTLTAIASQKKSEQKEVDITGGSQETAINNDPVNGLNAANYSENNYLLDSSYASNFTTYYSTGTYSIDIQKVEVWVYAEPNNPQRRLNIAFTDLNPKLGPNYYDSLRNKSDSDGVTMSGNFIKLDPSEYTLNRYAGYITLANFTSTLNKDAIAVAYTVSQNNGQPVQYGDYANESPNNKLVLKMLRTRNLQSPSQNPAHGKLWSRMLKNIYSTGVRNIKNDASNLTVKIVKKPSGVVPQESYVGSGPANGKSYLTLTKLDLRTGITPNSQPDGAFDFLPNQTIDLVNGNIIFPDLKPFSKTLRDQGVPDTTIGSNDSIYTSSKSTVGSLPNPIIFYITGTVKGEASNKYSLGFNVVEGSVKVFNGSVELVSGSDYTIDYSTGELLIRNNAALAPGAALKITYESNDLFTLASKTLLGTRAEFQINKTSYLGFTLINLKQQTLNDKVRIGEEPTNNTLIGFDAATDFKLNFLTKLVNKIPGYNTKEESSVTLNGEVAFMLPDPNTKKSLIPGDNGESVAYIDDFEGAKKLIPLGLNPLSWAISSMPIDNSIVDGYGIRPQVEYDSLMSNRRSRLNWFTLINDVPITEVYPQRTIATNQNQNLSPFVFDIKPSLPGMYNFLSTSAYQSQTDIANKNWSGVFKFLNTSQTNLVDENVNYIEVWMKIGDPANFEGDSTYNPGDSAKMIFDLGTISERIIGWPQITSRTSNPQTDYHTEDYNLDGQLSIDEDNGITGWTSDMKSTWGHDPTHGFVNQNNGDDPNDPFRDKFTWTQGSLDFTGFNGTWLNATYLTEAKKIDQEDVNNSGTLDLQNSYFEYVIPIDPTSIRHQIDIAGGGNKGWYQFNIPLSEFTSAQGLPSLTNIQYARIWFKGMQRETVIKIADMNLVGNQWVKLDKTDTTYTVGVVSIEENPNIYQSPVPGNVLRQRDQSQTDQNVLSNEQSMSVEVRKLLPGQTKFVQKSFATRPLDLINYKILKMFIDGDPDFKYFNTSKYDASMVIRIGYDTANFYEYRAPIHPDPRPGSPWNTLNEVSINLADMTAIKQSIDSTKFITYIDVPNGPPGSKYGIRGNPSIRNVNNIYLGVANSNSGPVVTTPLTGSVWFNEMRVLKTNDNSGYAYTIGAKVKVADLAAIDISYSKTDPNFHSLEDRFGSLSNTNSWQISGTFNAHKLINALLSRYLSLKFKNFLNMPITFSHQEDYDRPLYLPNTDVSLETAMQSIRTRYAADPSLGDYYANQLAISTQTLTVTNRFSINGFKVNLPGDGFVVQQMVNKIEVSFSRNSSTQRSPTDQSKTAWDMAGTIGMSSAIPLMDMYHLNIGKFLPLGDEFKEAKLYFFFPYIPLAPLFTNNLSLGAGFTRSHGDELLRAQLTANPTTRSFAATRNFNLDWKFIEGWLVDVSGNYAFNAGSDLTYLETTNDSLRNQRSNSQIYNDIFFGVHLINFGHDQNYSQTISINPKLNIPGFRNFVDLTTTYRSAYGWRPNDLGAQYGSTVGFNSDMETSAFLKLNQIFNLFKGSGKDDKKGGAFSSRYQDDKRGMGEILKMLGTFVPDQITISLSQSRQVTNPSVAGRPGFANFWMDGFNSKNDNGPSRLYQMGWIDNPGPRIPGTTFNDNLTQNNTITLNTFITPIFPNNLKISFQYKVTTDKSKNSGYLTDQFGNLGQLSINDSRTITRPSFFVNSDIISQLGAPYDTVETQGKRMADAFDGNFIKFPFPTWNLTLTGIEKFEMFSGFAQTISLESGYSSEYTKQYVFDGFKPEYVTRLALNSGFSPLIGVNITFKPLSGGNLTAQFKLSKTDNYALSVDNANLTWTATTDLSINASYTKSGFSLPFFGLALKNDLTISFSYTRTKNDPLVYTYNPSDGAWDSSPLNGSINTSLNPSIQYALSKSVSVSIFYKFTKLEPTSGTIQTTASSSNEAGLNVKLTIQ